MTPAPVLVRHSDTRFQKRLNECLKGEYDLLFLPTAEDVSAELRQYRPAAILFDPADPVAADRDVLRAAHRLHPGLPAAIVTPTNASDCFSFLRMYGLGSALPPNIGVAPAHLHLFFKHLVSPFGLFSLREYASEGSTLSRERITSTGVRTQVLEQLLADFETVGYVNLHDLQLVYEEILNNAIFHAFRTEKNLPKYSGVVDAPFDVQDQIFLEWAVGADYSILAVTDNQGLLARHVIWDRFLRQTNLSGLLDTSGRGLYLTHLLCKLVLITVSPGLNTRINVFFSPGSGKDPKPISVQVVKDGKSA